MASNFTIDPVELSNASMPFPSLYIIAGEYQNAKFLANPGDVWKFSVLWTIIVYECFHIAASGYAAIVSPQNWKASWLIVLFYIIFGGIEALFAGSMVGLM